MARHKKPAGSISIGRNTPFGSPIKIGDPCPICGEIHRDAGSTGPCYQTYLKARLSNEEAQRQWATQIAQTIPKMPIHPDFQTAVAGLYGNVLFCPGCGVDSPTCHGRILEKESFQLHQLKIKS